MTYQAIARKWRPQRFEDIAGQAHITRTVQNAIRLDRVHHAYLFCGARGVGKTSAARILAKALQCDNGPAENPCNECVSCEEVTRGSHPDVTEIDGASNNRVDDVRDLIETVRYMPTKGKRRIYIIDEVHMVTTAAFNALLKTLEEPPAHVVFIFATTDAQKLPDTVVSRCQRFDFKMLPARIIHDRMRHICDSEEVQVPDGVLSQIAREAAGSMRDGQSLLDQVLAFADGPISESQAAEILGLVDRSMLHELMRALVGGDTGQTLDTYGSIAGFGVDTRSLAADILALLRHATVAALVRDPDRLIDLPGEEITSLQSMAAEAGPDGLQRRFEILASGMDDIVRSDSPDLVLEMTLLRMARIRPYAPVEEVVDRLVELERRLATGMPPSSRPPARKSSRPAPVARQSRPAPEPRKAAPPRPEPPARPEPPPADEEPPPPDDEPPRPIVPPMSGQQRAVQARPAPAEPAAPPVAKPTPPPRPRPTAAPPPKPASPAKEPPAEEPPADEPPAGPAAPLDAGGWSAFVENLSGGRLGALRALAAEGRFLRVEDGELMLGYAQASTQQMASQRLADRDLLRAAARHFGRKITLRAVPLEDDSAPLSPAEQAREDAAQRRRDREQRARNHPTTEKLLSTFPGAEVVNVRHLTD